MQGDRIQDMVHYVVARSRPEELGATKLNKVLWFADLTFYRRLGRTISGAKFYKKLQHGPVPYGVIQAIENLIEERKISARNTETPAGVRREFVWLTHPNIGAFEAEEIDVLNESIDWICRGHSAASISAMTHDALWEEVELSDQIHIGAASVTLGDVTDEDIEWAANALDAR